MKHHVTSPSPAPKTTLARGSRGAMRCNGHFPKAVLDQQTSRGREGGLSGSPKCWIDVDFIWFEQDDKDEIGFEWIFHSGFFGYLFANMFQVWTGINAEHLLCVFWFGIFFWETALKI